MTSAAALALSALPVLAQPGLTEVDLELVLAVDISLSTTYEEAATQRRGYIQAFQHADLLDAIGRGDLGRIAVTYMEWSGISYQEVLVPWTVIDGPDSAYAFVNLLADAPLHRQHTTSISEAILYAADLIDGNEYAGLRRVIDISGDGPNNAGTSMSRARDIVVGRNITINGLPVVVRPDPWRDVFEGGVPSYYRDCVVGGDGSFLVTVTNIAAFSDAIRHKMVLEIAARQPEPDEGAAYLIPVQARPLPTPGPVNCAVGEAPR
ncbi:MAG: DUF1194 domain-containing protein [Bauldia sp.]|nr:DUF1194 domain-containing protein [Bauldia sp.]